MCLSVGDRACRLVTACVLAAVSFGCVPYGLQHEIQRDSRSQIWLSERSQVRVRAAQSRVFDTKDKLGMLEAVVQTFQDIGFQIEVLDETLGIVSGKQFLHRDHRSPTYLLYDEESLVVFSRSYRTWGPFERRSDMVRLTVTVRDRNEQQLIVRASAQFFLRPVERPEPYQRFYAALEKALFLERIRSNGSDSSSSGASSESSNDARSAEESVEDEPAPQAAVEAL